MKNSQKSFVKINTLLQVETVKNNNKAQRSVDEINEKGNQDISSQNAKELNVWNLWQNAIDLRFVLKSSTYS